MSKQQPPRVIHYSDWTIESKPKALVRPHATPPHDPRQPTVRTVQSKRSYTRWTGLVSVAACIISLAAALIFGRSTNLPANSLHASFPNLQTSAPRVTKPVANIATQLPQAADTACPNGTVLTVVAHEDDDILFMNPALQQEVATGMCVRTVYLTAGDDGKGAGYWRARERGPDAAYAAMLGVPNDWHDSAETIAEHSIEVHTLAGHPQVSLFFLRLPDGNTHGQGFSDTGYQSLAKLRSNEISAIIPVDDASSYTSQQLADLIRSFIDTYRPTILNTQAASPNLTNGDHSDHQSVGYLVSSVAAEHFTGSLHRYIGYQAGNMPVNLTSEQSSQKLAIFHAYEQDDPMICSETMGCFNGFVYKNYLGRMYEQTGTVL